jgi:hypothetical protein
VNKPVRAVHLERFRDSAKSHIYADAITTTEESQVTCKVCQNMLANPYRPWEEWKCNQLATEIAYRKDFTLSGRPDPTRLEDLTQRLTKVVNDWTSELPPLAEE